jgi:hypothetical protein
MEKENKTIVILDNTLSTVQSIFAALLYTITFAVIFFYSYMFYTYGFLENVRSAPNFIFFFCFCFAASVKFSKVSIIEVDVLNKLIFITTRIVFYKNIKTIEVIEFEYVVLVKKNFAYEITLWYDGNRHFTVLNFSKITKANLYAKSLCKQLKIDLLDRTSGRPVWIENAEL